MPHTMVNLVHKVFNESYYFQQLNDSPADGWSDYMSVGFDLDIPPSPFVNPALIRYFWNKSGTGNEASFDKTLTDAEFIALSPLLDVEYCAQQNNWQVADTRTNAISALRRGEWIDFHPLLTQRDFTNSRLKDISIWIETISDIERSLTDQVFERFSPSYYRATAASLIFSNELVDYLLNGINSGGAPHVFCDFWYSHQFSEKQGKPSRRSDVWQSMLIDFGAYGKKLSPFFDPLEFNHSFFVHDSLAPRQHPLTTFLAQSGSIIWSHPDVIPSALAYSFLNRFIDDCDPGLVSGVDVVKALEIALTGQTDAPENVELSVCILNFNKPVHSILSAIAVAQNAPAHTEILLLDNGSSPKDYELMTRYTRRYKNIRVTRCPRNLYFGEGNNVLLDQALGQRILFLNNDAYVGPTTLQTMMDHLDQFRETAAVGVTFLFPNLEVQEAGGFVSDCGQQIQLHKHSSFEQQRKFEGLKIPQQTQYISSACFCVRREILDELGGYDAIYEPLYFEDSDLCKRISSAGYRIDYLPWDYVIHFENASTREFLGSNFEAQIT